MRAYMAFNPDGSVNMATAPDNAPQPHSAVLHLGFEVSTRAHRIIMHDQRGTIWLLKDRYSTGGTVPRILVE